MCMLKLYSFITFSTNISSVAPMRKPPCETEHINHTLRSALELTIWWARKINKQTIKMQCYTCIRGRGKHRALFEYRRGVGWRSRSFRFCLWACFGVCEDSQVRRAPPSPHSALCLECAGCWSRWRGSGGCGALSPGEKLWETGLLSAVEARSQALYVQKRLGFPWRKWEGFEVFQSRECH